MMVNKCDICHKEITRDGNKISISNRDPYHNVDICQTCGKPVFAFLKKHWLDKDKLAAKAKKVKVSLKNRGK